MTGPRAGAAGERGPAGGAELEGALRVVAVDVGAELTASHRAFPGGTDVADGVAAIAGDGHAHGGAVRLGSRLGITEDER